MIYCIIRNDDLCALSNPDKEKRVLSIFERYKIQQVIGVIPNVVGDPHDCRNTEFHHLNSNPVIVNLLKEYKQKGLIEIAQHGATHQTNYFNRSKEVAVNEKLYYGGIDRKWIAFSPVQLEGYSEFKGLDEETQRNKITEGRDILEGIFGKPVETFIFPWNNADELGLKLLSETGFKWLLCEKANSEVKNLNMLGQHRNDLFGFPKLMFELERVKSDVLVVILYHSWMLGDKEIGQLTPILESLTKNPDVRFILPNDIFQYLPNFRKIAHLKHKTDHMIDRAITHLPIEPHNPTYYVFDQSFYWSNMMKPQLILSLAKLGIKNPVFLVSVKRALRNFRNNIFPSFLRRN